MFADIPPKKRYKYAKLARKKREKRSKEMIDFVLRKNEVAPSPGVVEVRLCAGGGVGSCRLSELKLNITRVLDIDCRVDHLKFDGSKVHIYQRSRADAILDKFLRHDFSKGPFKLAAELEPGWRVPTVEDYDAEVGVLRGGWQDNHNDLHQLLHIVRQKYPTSHLVVLASPPCRVASHANQKKDNDDVEDYMKLTERFFRRISYLKHTGACDALLVEWSAAGRRKNGVFQPGAYAAKMLEQMNQILNNSFTVKPIQAANYGCPSKRKRLLFADQRVFDYLPNPLLEKNWRGWGLMLGVCNSAKMCLVTRTWRAREYHGKDPNEPTTTLTTMGQHIFINRSDEEVPTLFAVTPSNLAKLIGVDPFDPKLRLLERLPVRQASVLVGISFSVQWYLAVMVAQMAAARYCGRFCGVFSKEHANTVFWYLENWRRARHPKPIPGLMPRWYKFKEDLHKGKMKTREYKRRIAYFKRKFSEMKENCNT